MGWNLVQQAGRRHQIWALTRAEDMASIEPELKKGALKNVQFCYVGLPRWLSPLLKIQGGHQFYYHLWQLKAYFVARKLHRQLGFDLFHHITYGNDWLANFIGAFLGVAYVRGPGGGGHRTPKGFGSEYPLGGRVWEQVRSVGQWIFRHDPVYIRGQDRARAILVCNAESAATMKDRWSHKTHLFPVSGFSAGDMNVAVKADEDSGHFRVVTAGSLIRVKGFGLAIKAFAEFTNGQPQTELVIIGSGPEERRLRALVEKSQLQDKVHFIPWLNRDELLAQMASADVFLFPSLRDGGGTVVVEAMALGKPVVCLDNGGPGFHITDDWGMKIAPTAPEEAVHRLAEALRLLYQSETLRVDLGNSARERVKKFYQWDKLGDRLMKIYLDAVVSRKDA